MNTRLLSLLLLLFYPIPSTLGEEVSGDAPMEFQVVANEDLHPLTQVTQGDETWVLHLGPAWFWEDEDFRFKLGDTLKVHGEAVLEDGVMQLYPFRMSMDGREIRLANKNGVPLWARGHHNMGMSDRRGRRGRGQGRQGDSGCWGR